MADDETSKTNDDDAKPASEPKEQEDGNAKVPQEYKKQPLREELVNTAVHFLQNPKVQSSSLVQKRAFLLRKGLTSEEVDVAIERSGFGQLKKYTDNSHPISHQSPPPPPPVILANQPPQNVPVPILQSVWTRLYNLMSFAVTIGGVYYGAIMIYRRYIEPRLATPKANYLDFSVENQLLELNESVAQLQQCLQDVQASLKKQQETLNEIACPEFKHKDFMNRSGNPTEITLAELKTEVATIKSLLLSRRQFPTSPLSNPSIPSWQLVNGDSTEESTNETLNGTDGNLEDQVKSKEINDQSTATTAANHETSES